MKKRIFLFAIILAVMSSVFAEVISFSFGELTDDNIIVTSNTSQSTLDKDTLDGGELKQSFEDNFKVEEKIKSANDKRAEKLKAEKKAAEDREKALMATEE